MYNKYSFSEYRNVGKYSPKSKYKGLAKSYNRLNEFKKFTPRTVNTKEKKKTAYNNARNLFDKLLCIYYNDYINIPNEEKEEMGEKYDPSNLLIKGDRFTEWKKEDKEKSKSQPEETIAKRVKLKSKRHMMTY